jgi:putative heme-binding domain-containing protein
MTGGMDNPVDVAFTATGERILTSTFVEQPQLGKRDGLLHAVYGGVYGKPNAVVDGHKRTGELMPILTQLGPAVPAGLTRYASGGFGAGFRDNFFAAMFNLRKVTRHVIEPSGATFTSRESDFLVSENRDFHPTDVLEDADGSLLVIDTGPWYKICCPTSQLAKPDVRGGIYRVRREGAPAVRDPRGRELGWRGMTPGQLVPLLDDRRPAVQNRAVRQLAASGAGAIPALESVLRRSGSAESRLNAVWALTRIDGAPARTAARLALDDRDESVRHAALHAAGLWRDAGAVPQLLNALTSGGPAVQRAAAEALGRVGDARGVPALLAVAAAALDRVLEHSVIYALIEINDPASTAASGLQAAASRSRRAALIALDQMDAGALKAESVIALLDSADPVLKDTAWWIAGHHQDWGGPLAAFFEKHLAGQGAVGAAREELQQKLAQFGDNPSVQQLLATTVERAPSKEERLTALRAMAAAARTRVKVLPVVWVAPLSAALRSEDADVTTHVLSVLHAAPAAKEASPVIAAALVGVSRDTTRPMELRLAALAASQDGFTVVDRDMFELLRSGLEPGRSVPIRSAAAAVIERATLDREQLMTLTALLRTAGPLELPRLLRAFGKGGDEAEGVAMLAALRQSAARSSVRGDILRPVLAKYPEPVRKEGDALLTSLSVDAAAQLRRVEELLPAVQGGDVNRGQAVFNSAKAACYSCHAIGYMGGRIGPDLTRIGQVRSERDLLEAIVFPSASFARGYEPVTIRTRSGEVRGGVLRSDLPDEVVLATGDHEETRIPRRDIVDVQPGTVSLMPQGLDEQLTRQELADLLAFLKATRSGA